MSPPCASAALSSSASGTAPTPNISTVCSHYFDMVIGTATARTTAAGSATSATPRCAPFLSKTGARTRAVRSTKGVRQTPRAVHLVPFPPTIFPYQPNPRPTIAHLSLRQRRRMLNAKAVLVVNPLPPHGAQKLRLRSCSLQNFCRCFVYSSLSNMMTPWNSSTLAAFSATP